MQHRKIRSHRKTSPLQACGPQEETASYPVPPMPPQACKQPRSTKGSLQEASLGRHVQDIFESLPFHRSAPELVLEQKKNESLAEKTPLEHFALEGEPTKLRKRHPPQQRQLDSDKLELVLQQLEALQEVVRKFGTNRLPPPMPEELAENNCKQDSDSSNNNNNNNNTDKDNNNTTNNNNNSNNNNNEPNNYNNNIGSQESSLNSFDLDNENPESEPDLDPSLGSSAPTWGVESNIDQQGAAKSLKTIGQQQAMTIGISLGSLIQQNQDNQKGMQIGTAWDPSLVHNKPRKRVSFDEANLARLRQNKGQQNNFQLRQLGSKTEKQELPAQNNTMTTAQTCWTSFQQANLQQQPAPAWEKKLQHEECTTNSLDREEGTLGSLKQNASTTNWPAYQTPKHNNNTSSLGIGTKNTAAWGILVDTGAAISLAPWDFAQHIELRPLKSTLQLRSVTGEVIQAYGTRTVQLVGATFSFQVSFVIASVQHALLGMDALRQNQLSLCRNNFQQYHLVNTAGAAIQLKTQGHLLYIEACSRETGFSTCKRSS